MLRRTLLVVENYSCKVLPETARPVIEGELPDLVYAAEFTASSADRLVRTDEQFWLESDDFDGHDANAIKETAERQLGIINGACSLSNGSYRPIHLSGRYESATGKVLVMIEARGEIRFTATCTALVNGRAASHHEPKSLHVIGTNPAVAEACRWLADYPTSWASLWKAYDIIREATGPSGFNRTGITTAGWATKDELDSFQRSANDRSISGDSARHATTSLANSVGSPITLDQGHELMRRIVQAWVGSLSEVRASLDSAE